MDQDLLHALTASMEPGVFGHQLVSTTRAETPIVLALVRGLLKPWSQWVVSILSRLEAEKERGA